MVDDLGVDGPGGQSYTGYADRPHLNRECLRMTGASPRPSWPDGGPFTMAGVQGRVVERLDGDDAWEVIDRISHKYTGQPYPLRTDRVVFLVEPVHAWAQSYA